MLPPGGRNWQPIYPNSIRSQDLNPSFE